MNKNRNASGIYTGCSYHTWLPLMLLILLPYYTIPLFSIHFFFFDESRYYWYHIMTTSTKRNHAPLFSSFCKNRISSR